MRIAIVGSGIAGLTCAHYLSPLHDVIVFEASARVGGHTNTVIVELDGRSHAIDTGFIVLNDRTYPNFRRLLNDLGVATRPTEMSFSLQCARTGLEYRGADLNGLFAQRVNLLRPAFYGLLLDLVRFNASAEKLLGEAGDELTVDAFFRRHRFGRAFREQYFYPMASAIWSCPHETIGRFPLRFMVEFYRHHGLLGIRNRPQWHVVDGGSHRYLHALLGRLRGTCRTGTPVVSLNRSPALVELGTPEGQHQFDHVIMACHSDQALKVLGSGATPLERELLGAFRWQENLATLHTDVALLPKQRRAWAAWNYHLPSRKSAAATLTYDMNCLQGLESPHRFCVSLNSDERIDPRRILYQTTYQHPVFTDQRQHAQQRHEELNGQNRTSYCGAWWGNGFHEDGVTSALRVVKGLGVALPILALGGPSARPA